MSLKYPWPEGLTSGEYRSSSIPEKAALRKKFNFAYSNGSPRLLNGRVPSPSKVIHAANSPHPDNRWPRTTPGAIQFIKDWNGAKTGQEFMDKFKLDKKGFSACKGRAKSMLKHGVPTKKHAVEGSHVKYDWDLLKQVATATAD